MQTSKDQTVLLKVTKKFMAQLHVNRFGADCDAYFYRLLWIVLGVAICIINYIDSKNLDYLCSFIFNSALFSLGEYLRYQIHQKGNIVGGGQINNYKISNNMAVIMRGIGENGSYLILGLGLADIHLNTFNHSMYKFLTLQLCLILFASYLLFTYLHSPMTNREDKCKLYSNRDAMSFKSIRFFGVMTFIFILCLFIINNFKSNADVLFLRSYYSFIYMSLTMLIWNLFGCYVGSRYCSLDSNGKQYPSLMVQLLGLTYSSFIEGGTTECVPLVLYFLIFA